MNTLHYLGQPVPCREGETVLDALLRAGQDIAFSCRSGVCQRCALRCLQGTVPPRASKALPERLREAGYFLACQCEATAPMVLAPRSPEHAITRCVLLQVSQGGHGEMVLAFEAATWLDCRAGQMARIVADDAAQELELVLLEDAREGEPLRASLRLAPGQRVPAWFWDAGGFGAEFDLRGPFPLAPPAEAPPLPPDTALWAELGHGTVVRQVLESFYRAVYADPLLAPFFARVTMDRVIGKQYAFLMQCMSGQAVYLGERPRNAHHWMVVPDSLFDHRQRLMRQALHSHGLDDALIARWMRYEEHHRRDIVKYQPWPRRIGTIEVDTERHETAVLQEATVCDYCAAEIAAGTPVRYHLRLGRVGCPACSPVPSSPVPSSVDAPQATPP